MMCLVVVEVCGGGGGGEREREANLRVWSGVNESISLIALSLVVLSKLHHDALYAKLKNGRT